MRNGFKQYFDAESTLLKSREDRHGNKISVTYDFTGRLSRLKDTLDRFIDVEFGVAGAAEGRLTETIVVLTKVSYLETEWIDESDPQWPDDPPNAKVTKSRERRYAYDGTDGVTTGPAG